MNDHKSDGDEHEQDDDRHSQGERERSQFFHIFVAKEYEKYVNIEAPSGWKRARNKSCPYKFGRSTMPAIRITFVPE